MDKVKTTVDGDRLLPKDAPEVAELRECKVKLKRSQDRTKRLLAENESLGQHLEDSRRANRKKFITRKRVRRTKSETVRVIIPDSHGAEIDPVIAPLFLADLKILCPDEIVMTGDHINCGGFLAQHLTVGYVAETSYTFEEDVEAANQFLDAIQANAPKVGQIDYLEGNHCRRIEKWCVTAALKNGADAKFLLSRLSPTVILNMKERDIKYAKQSECYDNLSIPGTIKRGLCHYTHGMSAAKHAASVHVDRIGGNIVFGHTHRMDSYHRRTVVAGEIAGWSCGCLCKKQPLWQHTRPTDWVHGYGLQLVARSGKFLHINVRFVDGASLLMGLLK